MILCGWPIHDPVSREERIADAEDHADQVVADMARESYAESIGRFNARMLQIQAEYEAAERADQATSS